MGGVAFFGCGGALRSIIKTPLMFTEDELIHCIEIFLLGKVKGVFFYGNVVVDINYHGISFLSMSS